MLRLKVLSATPGERKLFIAELGLWVGVFDSCDQEYSEVLLLLEFNVTLIKSSPGAFVRKVCTHSPAVFCW
jgi:hypothetical protein